MLLVVVGRVLVPSVLETDRWRLCGGELRSDGFGEKGLVGMVVDMVGVEGCGRLRGLVWRGKRLLMDGALEDGCVDGCGRVAVVTAGVWLVVITTEGGMGWVDEAARRCRRCRRWVCEGTGLKYVWILLD